MFLACVPSSNFLLRQPATKISRKSNNALPSARYEPFLPLGPLPLWLGLLSLLCQAPMSLGSGLTSRLFVFCVCPRSFNSSPDRPFASNLKLGNTTPAPSLINQTGPRHLLTASLESNDMTIKSTSVRKIWVIAVKRIRCLGSYSYLNTLHISDPSLSWTHTFPKSLCLTLFYEEDQRSSSRCCNLLNSLLPYSSLVLVLGPLFRRPSHQSGHCLYYQ